MKEEKTAGGLWTPPAAKVRFIQITGAGLIVYALDTEGRVWAHNSGGAAGWVQLPAPEAK